MKLCWITQILVSWILSKSNISHYLLNSKWILLEPKCINNLTKLNCSNYRHKISLTIITRMGFIFINSTLVQILIKCIKSLLSVKLIKAFSLLLVLKVKICPFMELSFILKKSILFSGTRYISIIHGKI
jgi:hypothetical protein